MLTNPHSSFHAATGKHPLAYQTGQPLRHHLGAMAAILFACVSAAQSQTPPPATPAPTVPAPAAPAKEAAAADPVATRFLTTCAGCHTLTEVKITGPGLITAATWPLPQLQTAIKRMEEKVGPLKDDELLALADFIKDGKAKERLAAEQEKMQARFMAKMAPADAALGAALFAGSLGLRQGGLACAACHSISGRGGNLGPDLTGIFTKMGGKAPLISAITKANFKIMAAHYQRHPITTQEAIHLTEYFSKLDANAPVAAPPAFAQAGAGIAALLLAGLTFYLRGMRATRRRDNPLTRRRK